MHHVQVALYWRSTPLFFFWVTFSVRHLSSMLCCFANASARFAHLSRPILHSTRWILFYGATPDRAMCTSFRLPLTWAICRKFPRSRNMAPSFPRSGHLANFRQQDEQILKGPRPTQPYVQRSLTPTQLPSDATSNQRQHAPPHQTPINWFG